LGRSPRDHGRHHASAVNPRPMAMSEPRHPGHAPAEEAILASRASKAAAVRARGENPFANDLFPSALIGLGDLRARFSDALAEPGKYDAAKVQALAAGQLVHVAGRVVAARAVGKLAFLRIRDARGELQLFCTRQALADEWARLDEIEVADFVEAEGPVIVTKTGELSVEPQRIRLLTKALRPLPDKWHGLTDVEMRYRQRYVDLVANPDVKPVFVARSVMVRELRRYLDDRGFLEVETPSMHALVGGAAAKPFVTHHNVLDARLFMRIAPELYLKRLVVGGIERVYEIARCYRNEGVSARHNPEFTMLEFYCAYATYETLMGTAEDMIRSVDAALRAAMPREHERWASERPFSLSSPFARVRLRDAVSRALEKASLDAAVLSEIRGDGASIKTWAGRSARAKAVDWSNFRKSAAKAESEGEIAFLAYEYLAEPFLAEDYRTDDGAKSVPVFIVDYPIEVSPLARRKDADPTLVDRFELFVHGRELCNAFSELNDPADQQERFRAQVEKKARGDEEAMDYDADYIRALEHGMPPTAGFGMGIDRLAMMLTWQPSIRDVILFPLLRPERPASP
jgi:lysyl-tRNA synthetase class 2